MKSWLTNLPETFPDAMVIVDSQGRIIQANAQAASLFGFDERRMNGLLIRPCSPISRWSSRAGGPRNRTRPAATSNSWAAVATQAGSRRSSRSCR